MEHVVITAHEAFKDRMAAGFDGLWRTRRLPASELTGMEILEVDEAEGWIRTRFDAREHLTNAMGFIQGGLLSAMLDDTLSLAGTAKSGFSRLMMTHEMKTCYIAAARPGALFGLGRTIHLGRTLAFLEGELRDGDGKLLATATASARPFEPR